MRYIEQHRRATSWLAAFVIMLPSWCFAANKLSILPAYPKQLSNSSLQFTAALNNKDATHHVRWSSSNPAVARISSNGEATLLSPGTTTISARLGEREQRAATFLTVTTAANPVFSAQPTDSNVGALIDPGSGVPYSCATTSVIPCRARASP